ncbi:MAG: hypothetical protein LUF30_11790, partial [Lachnospiraceae bacterium]|nr:hypothetical protein [Lachnospiraceae bacterium]
WKRCRSIFAHIGEDRRQWCRSIFARIGEDGRQSRCVEDGSESRSDEVVRCCQEFCRTGI